MNEVSAQRRRLGEALLALVAAWLLLGLGAPEPATAPGADFDVDEAEYLGMGVASLAQLAGRGDATLNGQLPGPIVTPWRDGIHASTFGFQSPGLPKLLFGLVAAQAGVDTVDAGVWPRFVPKGLSKGEFKAHRQAAKAGLLPALGPARGLMRLLAALIAALLFASAHRIAAGWGSRLRPATLAGALAALLWILSPAALEAAHHVRPGLLPILFWCAGLVAALELGPDRTLALAILTGVALGLATAAKLNGALFAPLIPAFLYLKGARRARLAALTTLAAALSLTIFFLFAPGLWHDTLSGLTQILTAWRGDLAHQAALYGATVRVPTGRLDALGIALGGLATQAGPLAAWLPFAGALLGLGGLAALARGARHSSADRLTLTWCLVLVLGSGLLLPLDRLRYLTPLAAPTALAAGLLFARLASARSMR
jgi:hypothetical protein